MRFELVLIETELNYIAISKNGCRNCIRSEANLVV